MANLSPDKLLVRLVSTANMSFQQDHQGDKLRWTVTIEEPQQGTSVSDPVQCELEVTLSDENAIAYPASIRIDEINFTTLGNPEKLISSVDDLPVQYSFEIPPLDRRPTSRLKLNDSSEFSEVTEYHFPHAEAVHLAERIINGEEPDNIVKSIKNNFSSISDSDGFRGEIEHFTSFKQYIQIMDFIRKNGEGHYIDSSRTVMNRVLKPHSRYKAETISDLEDKVEFYSSQPNLAQVSVGDVIVEYIYDVISESNNKENTTIESLDEISSRFGLNHKWSDILPEEQQLSLLLSAYYVFGDKDSFETLVQKQDPASLPDSDISELTEHLADTLYTHAEKNEENNALASSLYRYASEIYEEIGKDERATASKVQSHIGKGFQSIHSKEYEKARNHFQSAGRESANDSELGGLFIFSAKREADAIKKQFQEDGDLESALGKMNTLTKRINKHPTIHLEKLDDVLEVKEYLEEKEKSLERKQSKVSISDEKETDDSPEETKREYTQVRRKQRDQKLKYEVKQVYNDTCAICGSQRRTPDGRPEVEVAHIQAAGDEGPDKIRNCLALCKLHHWAFDKGWISVDDDYSIIVQEAPHANGYDEFSKLEGNSLILPQSEKYHPDQKFFRHHREEHGF